MLKYICKRILQSLLVLFIVTFSILLILHLLPGDPVVNFLGENATPDAIAYYTKAFGLDQPVIIQYFKWLGGLLRGQLGLSITYSKDISIMLPSRIAATLSVTIPAFLLACVLGVTLGVLCATHRNGVLDNVLSSIANIGISMPSFWTAILLVLVFAMYWKILPVQGYTAFHQDPVQWLRHIILPVIVLSLGPTAAFTRQTRSAMLEVISQDYIRTARAQGLTERKITVGHALRNAMIPLITMMGGSIGGLVGGTVLIEQVFTIPGMGTLMISAVSNSDYFVVMDTILVMALFVTTANLIVDIVYGFVDPRIRIA